MSDIFRSYTELKKNLFSYWWMALPTDCQDYDTITATLSARYAVKTDVGGVRFGVSEKDFQGIPVDPSTFTIEKIVEEYRQKISGFFVNRSWGNPNKRFMGFWGFSDAGAVCVYQESGSSKNFRLTVSAPIESDIYKLTEEIGGRLGKESVQGTVYMAVSSGGGVQFNPMGVGGEKLIRENYSPLVNKDFDRVCSELQASKPSGRLTIVNGPPGTGKSFFIRGLIEACQDALFIVVQPGYVRDLVGPGGLSMLMSFRTEHPEKKIVVVLEDADDALAPRNDTDMGTISALLNLGDGILGAVMDVRIVATTNRETQEFDPAMKRPGRLSTHVTIGPLDAAQAATRISELTGNPVRIDGPKTLGEIYQQAYDSGWRQADETRKQRKVGFGT